MVRPWSTEVDVAIARRAASRLEREGLLPDDARYRAALALTLAEGRAHLDRGFTDATRAGALHAAGALGLGPGDLERVLGMGHQQAAALARLVDLDADDDTTGQMIRLGALFNLGISLFDLLHDRFPDRAATLSRHLDPASLAALMRTGRPLAETGDGAVDLVLSIVNRFFRGALALPGGGEPRRELARLIEAMHSGELASTRWRRDASPPTLTVLRQLRRKSALPLWTVAVLARLARPDGPPSGPAPARLRALVGLAADALWLVDDLVDVGEDLAANAWSRPLWLLARRRPGASLPGDAEALVSLLDSEGIIEAETGRLADRLRRLQAAREPGASSLAQSIGVAVRSWLAAPW